MFRLRVQYVRPAIQREFECAEAYSSHLIQGYESNSRLLQWIPFICAKPKRRNIRFWIKLEGSAWHWHLRKQEKADSHLLSLAQREQKPEVKLLHIDQLIPQKIKEKSRRGLRAEQYYKLIWEVRYSSRGRWKISELLVVSRRNCGKDGLWTSAHCGPHQ